MVFGPEARPWRRCSRPARPQWPGAPGDGRRAVPEGDGEGGGEGKEEGRGRGGALTEMRGAE